MGFCGANRPQSTATAGAGLWRPVKNPSKRAQPRTTTEKPLQSRMATTCFQISGSTPTMQTCSAKNASARGDRQHCSGMRSATGFLFETSVSPRPNAAPPPSPLKAHYLHADRLPQKILPFVLDIFSNKKHATPTSFSPFQGCAQPCPRG